jgi:hypothetical protein
MEDETNALEWDEEANADQNRDRAAQATEGGPVKQAQRLLSTATRTAKTDRQSPLRER